MADTSTEKETKELHLAAQNIALFLRLATLRIEQRPDALPFKQAEGHVVVNWLNALAHRLEEAASELPENLQSSALGKKLEEVCNLGIESLAETVTGAVDDAENAISEAEGIDLPRGFGRD